MHRVAFAGLKTLTTMLGERAMTGLIHGGVHAGRTQVRHAVTYVVLAVALSLGGWASADGQSRPNILWLTSHLS